MKRAVIIAAIAALALAGCSKESKDDADQNEISEETQCYSEWLSGTFHGERSIYREDVTFTPYDTPIIKIGVSNITANGEAEIHSWSDSDTEESVPESQTFNCYYVLELASEASATPDIQSIYFYQFSPGTGNTTDTGVIVPLVKIDDDSFVMGSYYWTFLPTMTYTRQ